MVYISSEESRNGRSGEKLDFLASVVSSGEAGLAFVANNVRFDGYTISNLEMFHRRVDSQDDSRRFVSEYVCIRNDHGPDAASVPEVNVGSEGIVSRVRLSNSFSTYPQIPVLLIPTVTSPTFRVSPFSILSKDGSASATHNLCSGFVKTPMFFFDGRSMAEGKASVVAEGLIFAVREFLISFFLDG
jgi:hypothetical protein